MSGHPVLPADPITLPLLPLRDVVVFPHMVIPLFVGRPKSIKALEAAMEAGRQIMLVAQKAAGKDEPKADDMFEVGCVSEHPADAETARRHREGAGRRRAARQHQDDHRQRRALRRRGRRRFRRAAEATPEIEALRRAVTQQFDQYVKLNKKIPPEILTSHRRHRRPGPPGRHDRRAPAAEARSQAVGARPVRGRQAAREAARAARARGRHPAGRKAHPRPRQAADGEEPARVLPERAGQGDPEGTRRRRRRRRPGRAREEDQRRAQMPKEAREEGRGRVEEAQADVADVGRSHGRAQLHRHAGQPALGEEDQDQARPGAMPRTVLNEDHYGLEKVKDRILEYLAVQQRVDKVKAPILCLVGPAGRRQDLARPERGARHRPQVRAHGAGRRARRGRDPRPPPHLHRHACRARCCRA